MDPEPRPPAIEELPRELRTGLLDFLQALRVEAGLARNTLAAYRSDLRRFLGQAVAAGRRRWRELSGEDVVDYLADLRRSGMAEATVARHLSAIRMCMRHLVAEGVLRREPTALISAPVLARSLPSVLSIDEVERLLAAPGVDDWRGQRDTALLEVLYACGARVSEALGLRTDALQPSLEVLVLHGKGNKTRIVPIGERARDAIERWRRDGRCELPGAAARPELFLTASGKPLGRSSAWTRVRAAALAAGIPRPISPHTLRHSFASHMIQGGADLRSVQEMLGHASIRTTEIYTHLDAEHVRAIHRLYHPRG